VRLKHVDAIVLDADKPFGEDWALQVHGGAFGDPVYTDGGVIVYAPSRARCTI